MTVVHLRVRGTTVADPAPVFHYALHRSNPLPTIPTVIVRRLLAPITLSPLTRPTARSPVDTVHAGFRRRFEACRLNYRLRQSRAAAGGEFRCKLAGYKIFLLMTACVPARWTSYYTAAAASRREENELWNASAEPAERQKHQNRAYLGNRKAWAGTKGPSNHGDSG